MAYSLSLPERQQQQQLLLSDEEIMAERQKQCQRQWFQHSLSLDCLWERCLLPLLAEKAPRPARH